MISHKHKCIMVHIPKTAGTSMETFLEVKDIKHKHATADRLKVIYSKEGDTFFKFSFVRNPGDKLVSIYHYYKYGKNAEIAKSLKHIDFQQFCKILMSSNPPNWLSGVFSHPQRKLQINGINGVDYVGRFENLEQHWKVICDRINMPYVALPHMRKSDHDYYASYYTDTLVKLIGIFYKEDVKAFNYKFGQ